MNSSNARVVSVGLACPLGLRTMPAIAAIHADIVSFVEREDVLVPGGEATASALDSPALPLDDRTTRCAFWLNHALTEALWPVGDISQHPLACVVVVPDDAIGQAIDPQLLFARTGQVPTGAGTPARLHIQRIIAGGRAAVFEALELAIAMLDGGLAPLVLVAAVDSRVDTHTLAALANANRLESSANLDGYIPGEAAACVLLGAASAVPTAQVLATIVSLARARERQPISLDPGRVATAEGLADLFRQLRLGFGARVDEVFAAVTGERYYAQEFAHAYLRNAALMPEPLRQRSIAASLGDLGAAAGAVALVHAVIRAGPARAGNRDRPNAASLIYASGDDGVIGGCVLMSPHRH